jgi:plastocyanin
MRRWVLPVAGATGFALAVVPALAHDETVGTTSSDWTRKELALAPGHTITVRNTGGFHDLRWSDGAPGVDEAGPAWTSERTFTAADDGKALQFRCTVHGGMVGTVHVNQAETVPAAAPGTTSPGTTGTTPAPPPPGPEAPGGTTSTGTATIQAPVPDDRTPPRVSRLGARFERGRLVLRMRLDEAARVRASVLRGRRTLARRTFRGRAGANRFVVRVRPRRSLRVEVRAVDRAGNATRRTVTPRVTGRLVALVAPEVAPSASARG